MPHGRQIRFTRSMTLVIEAAVRAVRVPRMVTKWMQTRSSRVLPIWKIWGSTSPSTGPFAAPSLNSTFTFRFAKSRTPRIWNTPLPGIGPPPAGWTTSMTPVSVLTAYSGAVESMSSRLTLTRIVSPSVMLTMAPRMSFRPHVPGRVPISKP